MGRRLLTNAGRKFQGEETATPLLKVLNTPDLVDLETRKRISDFLAELQRLVRHASSIKLRAMAAKQRNDLDAMRASVNYALQRWRGCLVVQAVSASGQIHFDMAVEVSLTARKAEPIWEWEAVKSCLDLGRLGRIMNIRQCEECATWMFCKFPSGDRAQRRCPGCSDKWRKSPAYLKQMAAYMRDWRDKEKKKEQQSKKAMWR
jgi:hypothetical protein